MAFAAEPAATRIATYTVELTRKGPGLLLRDILSGKDEQVRAVQSVIAAADPDILLLVGFDFDHGNAALNAFADQLAAVTSPYDYRFALRPNSGRATGLDLDGDGLRGGPRDAHGYGLFAGAHGLAILSRYPILAEQVKDYSDVLWKDVPGSALGTKPDLISPEGAETLRLSSSVHWLVPVDSPQGTIGLAAFWATPPVFDGPEDRNGWRNHDEIALWHRMSADAATLYPVIMLGNANMDLNGGEGRRGALLALLQDPGFVDPEPRARTLDGINELRQSDLSSHHTARFRPAPEGPGDLRVDYILADARFSIKESGVYWPMSDDPRAPDVEAASRHGLVWVDVVLNGQA
ncbi:MAG: endonuclease/exonuclease/phosphatase family protein [Pseudomonadota bacterium]